MVSELDKMDEGNVGGKRSFKDFWNEKSDHSIGLSLFLFLFPILFAGLIMWTMSSA
jgi:hypothetical protein